MLPLFLLVLLAGRHFHRPSILQNAPSDVLVLVDVENVRGKSGFQYAHKELLHRIAQWKKHSSVACIVDHGPEHVGYLLQQQQESLNNAANSSAHRPHTTNTSTLGVIFAGPRQTADDVIATSIGLLSDRHVVVITADLELQSRCRKQGGQQQQISIVSPIHFLEELECLEGTAPPLMKESVPFVIEEPVVDTVQQTDAHIRLQAQYLEAQKALINQKNMSRKKRRKLEKRTLKLRDKLQVSQGVMESNDMIVEYWSRHVRTRNRRELTGDRVLLAEQLHRDISAQAVTCGNDTPHERLIQAINGHRVIEFDDHDASVTKQLTLTVISDTHGMEHQLEPSLPETDVLLHLGDFAVDGSLSTIRRHAVHFDAWLSQQPHKYKIVLRGNHDPFTVDFEQSQAVYITQPQSLNLSGLTLALIPYGSSRMMKSYTISSNCNILASHVPPKYHLDKCLDGRHAGSASLLAMVGAHIPRVWLCGHIHESRGVLHRRWRPSKCGRTTTTFLNAANANPGQAEFMKYGPVVVQLDERDELNILGMEANSKEEFASQADLFYAASVADTVAEDKSQLLLAVDLGLKSGLSLFNDQGQLLRYEQFRFACRDDMTLSIPKVLEQWEEDAPNTAKISHIAIEGADVALRDVWRQAIEEHISLLYISPEEWRSALLSGKEKETGPGSKAAARLIARQVVDDFGVMNQHEGKFRTDSAEAVVMGYHVARKLGWVTREPPVRRFMNGKVMVPKKR